MLLLERSDPCFRSRVPPSAWTRRARINWQHTAPPSITQHCPALSSNASAPPDITQHHQAPPSTASAPPRITQHRPALLSTMSAPPSITRHCPASPSNVPAPPRLYWVKTGYTRTTPMTVISAVSDLKKWIFFGCDQTAASRLFDRWPLTYDLFRYWCAQGAFSVKTGV